MKIYSHGIHINPVAGMQLEGAVAIQGAAGQEFEEHVTKCLDRLKTIASGRKIIEEINGSGHVCTIFSAPVDLTKDQNVAKQNPPSMANEMAVQVKPFRPRHKNLLMRQREENKDKSPNEFVANFKQQMAQLGLDQKKAELAPELVEVLTRARAKYSNPLKQIPPLIGVNLNTFAEMCAGKIAIPDDVYFKLCFLLYDYLSPGVGADTYVRFQPYPSFQRDFGGDFKDEDNNRSLLTSKSRTWRNLASTILGHELIHAWRMMKGRRIVMGGAWEEEAMTTGVGPFLNWKPTENTIRREFGLTERTKYGTGSCSCGMMAMVMMGMNWSKNYQTTEFF